MTKKNMRSFICVLMTVFSIVIFSTCEETAEYPTSSFIIEGEYEINSNITFISTSENATEFNWSFGDGKTAIGAVVTHKYDKAGKYTIVLTVQGENGDVVNSEPQTIEIEDNLTEGLLQVPESVLSQVPSVSTGTFGAYTGNIPSSFFLDMPPAGHQGGEGSCVGWAVAYGAMSYIYFNKIGYGTLNSVDYTKILSPEFLYNQVKTSSDCKNAGAYFVDYNGHKGALNFIKEKGCCTWEKMPYLSGDCSLMPNNEQILNALQYKILDFKRITKLDFTSTNLKKLLLQNKPIIIGIDVYPNFKFMIPDYPSGAYVYDKIVGEKVGGHAVVVYGYDDDIKAYKILNSWGENWANSGSFWIPYDFFSTVVGEAYIIETSNVVEKKSINVSGDLSFGNVTVNTNSTKTLTIQNTGTSSIYVSSIDYPNGFSGSWSGSINSGQSKSVTVTFRPTTGGNYNGTITVNSDATSGNNTLAISGAGIQTTNKTINVSGDLSFGNVTVNTNSTKTLTIQNTGTSSIYVSSINYPNGFSGSWSGSINSGQSKSVTVTFRPTTSENYNGTITVNSNATSGNNTLSVSGYGVQTVTLPTVTTYEVTRITENSANSGGNITSDGGSSITSKGVCWSTSSNPTINNSKINNGSGSGSFTSNITGLESNRTYYVRAYATNSKGTAYGNQISFKTVESFNETVTDYDGNTYQTVTIGSQIWITENLRSTHYSNGTTISGVYVYNNDNSNATTRGRLYTQSAALNGGGNGAQGVCPVGWHIPTENEIDILLSTVGSSGRTRTEKLCFPTGWAYDSNFNPNNSSGLSIKPVGYWWGDKFRGYKYSTVIWTSTSNKGLYMDFSGTLIKSGYGSNKAMSVRCIKN